MVMVAQLCEHSEKTIDLYILNQWIVWYVSYISVKNENLLKWNHILKSWKFNFYL